MADSLPFEHPEGQPLPFEGTATAAGGPPGVPRPDFAGQQKAAAKPSIVPNLVKMGIQTIPGTIGTVGGGIVGAGLGPAGAAAGAGLGAAAGETASQAIERAVFGDGVKPTSKEGMIRTGTAGVLGAALEGATNLHPIEAGKALISPRWAKAARALVGKEAAEVAPEVGAASKLVTKPGELDPYVGRDPLTGDRIPVGAKEPVVVRPGFGPGDVKPGARGKLLVTPGEAGEAAAGADEVVPSMARRGGTIIAPEPTKTLIGGEKTAFSLPKGAPLDRATLMGRESAADIKAVREGKPLIYTPKEGTGYPGPRSEAPLVERRAAERPKLMSPTEIEEAMKNRKSIRTPFDVTEGASATIARDVDRLAGPAPGARIGSAAGAERDTALFAQARRELGDKASISEVAQRAEELKRGK